MQKNRISHPFSLYTLLYQCSRPRAALIILQRTFEIKIKLSFNDRLLPLSDTFLSNTTIFVIAPKRLLISIWIIKEQSLCSSPKAQL